MTNKIKSKISFSTLFIGLSIGLIVGRNIPEVRAYNDHATDSRFYTQETALPGQPLSSFFIHRPGYSLAYDARNRNPSWVYEHLTAESIRGKTERALAFKEDDNIPKHLRATQADYRGSGLDRGHMAPAANHHSSSEEMADTFFMTNMCPQCPQFNRGYWSKLEKHVRDLTKNYQNIYVITGPLYLPHQEVDGKRYVKYQVIGKNDVAVPTHFFKVISCEDKHGRKASAAYILPNQDIPSRTPLKDFQTTIEKIEKAAGMILSN